MHAERYDEAARVLTICNACRYCEGHCAVFPAIERRVTFARADVDYLANLCHNCGSCYHHCQYAPPHEFEVDVPDILELVRQDNYRDYAWPRFLHRGFANNGILTVAILVLAATLFIATAATPEPGSNPGGDFYELLPHRIMATLFGTAAVLVLISLIASLGRYWVAIGLPGPVRVGVGPIMAGIRQGLSLANLGGGAGEGCTWPGQAPSTARRHCHHLVFYGFLACFAATVTGTIYHYGFDWPAPYPLVSLPKILGTGGGIAIIIGTAGLMWLGRQAGNSTSGRPFTLLLMATAITGLALMVLRETPWLGLMLSVHLASVLTLFVLMPCGKFVHGLYRLVALIASEWERSGRAD